MRDSLSAETIDGLDEESKYEILPINLTEMGLCRFCFFKNPNLLLLFFSSYSSSCIYLCVIWGRKFAPRSHISVYHLIQSRIFSHQPMHRLLHQRSSAFVRASYKPSLLIRRTLLSNIPTADLPPETISIVPSVAELTKPEFLKKDFDGSLVGHLFNRGLLESLTSDDLYKLTEGNGKKMKLYCGADPTAESLHLGNLLPLMVLLHFVLRGHDIVGLVGGATGAVGDPSGRKTERAMLEESKREDNVAKIQQQMVTFFQNGIKYAQSRQIETLNVGQVSSANNASWWKSITFLDFLSTYGTHIRVSQMLARDSILSRLQSQQGIGFNEFAYQVLQAYDFWHLFKNEGVNIQLGGNDQWGNITAGTDFISRVQRQFGGLGKKGAELPAYGMTVPLLTTASGEKFGKSAGNAVFISSKLTTPYQLYQFFVNAPDDLVNKLLRTLTLLPDEAIDSVVLKKHEQDPANRIAQRVLAREVVDMIHGPGVGDEMAYITSFLFPTPDQPFDDDITADKLISKFKNSGILQKIQLSSFPNPDDIKMSTLLSKIFNKSKNETKKLIKGGGVYFGLNRDQFIDPDDVVLFDKDNHLIDKKLFLVRSGKQNYYVVEIQD